MAQRPDQTFHAAPRLGALPALLYASFVVYGSLVPLAFRPRPLEAAFDAFLDIPYLHLGVASRADWIANILLYIPLAFFLCGWLAPQRRGAGVWVLLSCALLALSVEFAQLFFPPRTVSLNDLAAEIMGTGLGMALWYAAGERLLTRWRTVLRGGREAGAAFIALYALAYLLFSLFPYDFLVSASELAEKLASPDAIAFFMTGTCAGSFHCAARLGSEILVIAPLGALLGMSTVGRRGPSLLAAFGWGLLLGAAIEGMQVFLASGLSQGASIVTRGLGAALGLVLYRSISREWILRYRLPLRAAAIAALPIYIALLLALVGFYGARVEGFAAAMAKLGQVRFLPFYYHYFTTETQAIHSLLIHTGAYAPVGLMVWLFTNGRPGRGALWISALAAFALALGMEALKLFLQGRRPDPTDALIAAAAAALACFAATQLYGGPPSSRHEPRLPGRPELGARRLRGAAFLGGLFASGAALAGWLIAMQPREHYVDESRLRQLPAPEALAVAALPGFRLAHPRLPSPSAADIEILRRHSSTFIKEVRGQARGGQGDLARAPVQELLDPGSVDLDLLYRRLMDLKFSSRGDEQVKPLAVAYDWLYARWTASQLAFLRGRLAEGCEYLIDLIRKERLSPYNVILYNSPLQALMACSIALYKDDPRGDAFMAFTADLWKNRVLPVWRQVMGRNGGWHEGGEYVGIGIGQAIYQLPAMWRQATGEDFFASEPGIRGFLDFLVYRTQPDGTHFRWGDGAYFDRDVPDAHALALEYGHKAAYSLKKPSDEPRPTSWPWGPLTERSMYDPEAIKALPLTKHFDGIGLVVARSDWSPDATYVTFKAGDNFWSHVHLDQGAFTLYKGGPLAIDSGLYGPKYGSDHHMNYAYQTIAHNTVTVTDPKDNAPAPRKDGEVRPIANDGGQRRVGSGWGVEAAPLDLDEWNAKAGIYRTGTLKQVIDADGLLIAAADLTAAYTNDLSGKGTFSHRTRRVERFWRVFAYDRVNDVVVVFDDLRSTRAEFRKRWLLHAVSAPQLTPAGFVLDIPAQSRPGRGGGRLEGKVVLPLDANVHAIGGSGFEFFAGDRNYDEAGNIQDIALKRGTGGPEPGAWRIEVSPRFDALAGRFLVALRPARSQEIPAYQVRQIDLGSESGCEIAGPRRSIRFLFKEDDASVRVDVSEGPVRLASHRVALDPSAAPVQSSWWSAIVRFIGRSS